ncbi:MAG: glycosyl hydrolase family 28-related protein [Thermoleophilaceae bacterium]
MTGTTPPAGDGDARTRRSVLAGGVAGAAAAAGLTPGTSHAQLPMLDPVYVWRDRMPVNVKDAGALGNGEDNDAPAVQAVIDDLAAAGGGSVYFPPGDYVINGGLAMPLTGPIRLAGAGALLGPVSGSHPPTRLIRTAGSSPIVSAGFEASGIATAVYSVEICDMHIRGGLPNTAGRIADFAACNPLNLYNVNFDGGDGVRLRQVYNSNGSGLYFHAMGTPGTPALLFDALPVEQGGCATVHWTNVEWEGNSGIDLMLDGHHAGGVNAPTVDVRITNWKAEGGANGPHIKLAYAQSITLDVGYISFHGRGTSPAVVVDHAFGGTSSSNKLPTLEINYSGTDAPQDAIQILSGTLDIGQLNVVGSPSGPTRSAIRVESGAAPDALKLGQVRSTLAVLSDARPRAQYANPVEVVPKVRAYATAAAPVPSGAVTALALDSERFDAGTAAEQHAPSDGATRLTCRVPGLYAIHGAVEFAASAGGSQRAACIRLNGTTIVGGWFKCPSLGPTATVGLTPSTLWQLNAGDYVELVVFQDSGAPLQVISEPGAAASPELSMAFLSA